MWFTCCMMTEALLLRLLLYVSYVRRKKFPNQSGLWVYPQCFQTMHIPRNNEGRNHPMKAAHFDTKESGERRVFQHQIIIHVMNWWYQQENAKGPHLLMHIKLSKLTIVSTAIVQQCNKQCFCNSQTVAAENWYQKSCSFSTTPSCHNICHRVCSSQPT